MKGITILFLVGVALDLLMGSAHAQDTARKFCGEPGHVPCDGCRCVDDILEVVFPNGDDLSSSVFQFEQFSPDTVVPVVILVDTKSDRLQGLSYGVTHDASHLTLVPGSVTTLGTDLDDLVEAEDFKVEHEVNGGFFAAVALTGIPTHIFAVRRNTICRASYRIAADPGSEGAKIEFTESLSFNPDSPRVNIDLTISGVSSRPKVLVDGLIKKHVDGAPIVPEPFLRCDSNDDRKMNIGDAVWILNELFYNGPPSACEEAADCNGDGAVQISDAIFCLSYQFSGGPAPPPPFPECGPDGGGALECKHPLSCSQ